MFLAIIFLDVADTVGLFFTFSAGKATLDFFILQYSLSFVLRPVMSICSRCLL